MAGYASMVRIITRSRGSNLRVTARPRTHSVSKTMLYDRLSPHDDPTPRRSLNSFVSGSYASLHTVVLTLMLLLAKSAASSFCSSVEKGAMNSSRRPGTLSIRISRVSVA